jgi:hypothetical protein
MIVALIALLVGLAWALSAPLRGAPRPGRIDERAAAALFRRVPISTDPGLSGLALDGDGRLWTVSERGHHAYRIAIDGDRVTGIERFAVDGVPAATDLESIGWLAPGRLVLGTEAPVAGVATVMLARVAGDRVVVERQIDLPASLIGVPIGDNAGTEGICGGGDVVLAALESVGVDHGRRFAPIVRLDLATGARVVSRLWLTSTTGKISSLDCSLDADGTARAVAIERHYHVSRLLALRIPPTAGDLTADEVTDLSPVLRGSLNLEGIVRRPDGRLIAVNDNQSGSRIDAASQLLFFHALVRTSP